MTDNRISTITTPIAQITTTIMLTITKENINRDLKEDIIIPTETKKIMEIFREDAALIKMKNSFENIFWIFKNEGYSCLIVVHFHSNSLFF